MDPFTDLDRRISRALSKGRGMMFTQDDLDLLSTSGAYAVLRAAAEQELRTQADQRAQERWRPKSNSLDGAQSEIDGAEELARVLEMTSPQRRHRKR
jgi:hypothetical protein